MINLAQPKHGEMVIYIVAPTLDCVDLASFVIALLSACKTSSLVLRLPSYSISQTLSNPFGVPLYPSDIIAPSLTIIQPTFLR